MNINITDKAKSLILINSKMWLVDKLGISRVTLDNRLKKHNWKRLEVDKLKQL